MIGLLIMGAFLNRLIAMEIIMVSQIIYCSSALGTENVSVFRVITSMSPIMGMSKVI